MWGQPPSLSGRAKLALLFISGEGIPEPEHILLTFPRNPQAPTAAALESKAPIHFAESKDPATHPFAKNAKGWGTHISGSSQSGDNENAQRWLRQEAEDGYAVRGAYEDFSVHDGGGDEFVAVAEVVAAGGGLVAVVELVERYGVVGVQDGGGAVLDGPYDSVAGAVC